MLKADACQVSTVVLEDPGQSTKFSLRPVPGPGIWHYVTWQQDFTDNLLEDDVQILCCSITSRYCAAKGSSWNPAES